MNRQEFMLAALAAGDGALHRPVQLQKMFFMFDREIPERIGGPHFHFEPYSYGPYDKEVYAELDRLAERGLARRVKENTWSSFELTLKGQMEGARILAGLPDETRNYVISVSEFVRRLTFSELVRAIYAKYPDMKANSVFQS